MRGKIARCEHIAGLLIVIGSLQAESSPERTTESPFHHAWEDAFAKAESGITKIQTVDIPSTLEWSFSTTLPEGISAPSLPIDRHAGRCDARCNEGCKPCDVSCSGCDFCNPSRTGPFGEAARFCRPTMQAFADKTRQTLLMWSAASLKGEEDIQSPFGKSKIEMDVVCETLCYEVWYSDSEQFSNYQTEVVSGSLTNLKLPALSPGSMAFTKVRALQRADVASTIGRSAWSSVIEFHNEDLSVQSTTLPGKVKKASTAPSTFLVGRPSTTKATTVRAVTTSTSQLPIISDRPTTVMPLFFLPTNSLAQGTGGTEVGLSFQVPSTYVASYATPQGLSVLQAAVAAMLQVDGTRVHILSLKAAKLVPGGPNDLQLRQLKDAEELGGTDFTGSVQVSFLLTCSTPEQRHTATTMVQALAKDISANSRFALAITSAANGRFHMDPTTVHAAMIDREWSQTAANQKSGFEVKSNGKAPTTGGSFYHSLWWHFFVILFCTSSFVLFTCALRYSSVVEAGSHEHPDVGIAPSGHGFDPKSDLSFVKYSPLRAPGYMHHSMKSEFSQGRLS